MIAYLSNSILFSKYRHWEYWPIWLVYLPVTPIILYYIFRSRRIFFFTNVNPQFKTGALLGASKYQILESVPDIYKPKSILSVPSEDRFEKLLAQIEEYQLSFPLIVKPDIGERGLLVEKLDSPKELSTYLSANKIDIIVQEYISYPNECGVFYVRKPSDKKGKVISIGLKAFLKVKGDGVSTLQELMSKDVRAKFQIKRFLKEEPEMLDKVLLEGEELELEPIGNHNRGTTFINGNHLKSQALDRLFDTINGHMDEVYYGRFDIKYNTWNELLEGKNMKILEMNGVASEPIHIYDDTVPIKNKYKTLYDLWHRLYQISTIQKSRGIHPIRAFAAFKAMKEYFGYIRSININWRDFSNQAQLQ